MRTTESILKMPKKAFWRRLVIKFSLCAAIIVLTVAVNICLTAMRSEQTHNAFLAANILSDIAAAWFVYSCAELSLLPGYRKYRLFCKAEHSGERITGSFIGFSEKQRYEKMNCVLAEFSCDGERRKIFIAENTFEKSFREGIELTLTAADNIAVLCEVAD